MNKTIALILCLIASVNIGLAQLAPSKDENIPYLTTFGNAGETNSGDDDFKQAFFFLIPESNTSPFFIRIFDPETSGTLDEKFGDFNTSTKFTVYGGNKIYSGLKGTNAADYSESSVGDILDTETFNNERTYDNKWYSFGPFNRSEGEYVKSLGGYVFKIVAEGIGGNDGNLYKYFLSSSGDENRAIAGANAFTYEFTVRLNNDKTEVSHLYPFIDDDVLSIKIHTFDFDSNVNISVFSKAKFGLKGRVSGNGTWSNSVFPIKDNERGACIDVRISNRVNNNNGVIYMTNQYGQHIPFMAVPIGEFSFSKDFEIK